VSHFIALSHTDPVAIYYPYNVALLRFALSEPNKYTVNGPLCD